MAIAFDSVQSGVTCATGINASKTFSFNNVAGDIVIVDVFTNTVSAADYVTGVTYNGVAMTRIYDSGDNGGANHVRNFCYYLVGPATGSNNVVISTNMANAFDNVGGTATSYSGAKQTGQPDSFSTSVSSGGSSPLTKSTTVVGSNCWLHGSIAITNNPTVGTGTTERAEFASGLYFNTADSNGTVGTGSQSLEWTWSGSLEYAAGVISIAAPVTGPANVKTVDGLAIASVKTVNGLAIGSVKTVNGLS